MGRDPTKPLKNKKHEVFCINLLTMKQGRAYTAAGYKQTGDNASKAGRNLLTNNNEVSQRFQYLQRNHNAELEKKGLISRELLIAKGIQAMNVALGLERVNTTIISKFEGVVSTEDIEVFEPNINAVAGIWDKLSKIMDYYPKEAETKLNIMPVINIKGVNDD